MRLHTLTISIVAFSVFLNTLTNDFTYDDFPTILENRSVTEGDIGEVLLSSRAVRQLSFMIDYRLFGTNPMGYHLENALLHSINSVLMHRLLLLLSFGPVSAFTASLLFAVHPIHVEAVAGIANRKELLSLFFILLSWIFYVRATRASSFKKRAPSLVLVILFYSAAVLSKQTAAFLPFIFMAYDLLFLQKKDRLAWRVSIPITAIFATYIIFRIAYPLFESYYSAQTIGYKPVILTAVSVFFWDAKYLLFPFQLSADHTIDIIRSGTSPLFIVSTIILLCYSTLLISFRDYRRLVLMLIWIPLFLLPTSNLIPVSSYFFAERYLYIPSLGYAALFGDIFENVYIKEGRKTWALIIAILLMFAYTTFARNKVWQNEAALWGDTVIKSPRSAFAHNNLGNIHYLNGDLSMAETEYKRAIEINPRHAESIYNLGLIYESRGEREKAMEMHKEFLRIRKEKESGSGDIRPDGE